MKNNKFNLDENLIFAKEYSRCDKLSFTEKEIFLIKIFYLEESNTSVKKD